MRPLKTQLHAAARCAVADLQAPRLADEQRRLIARRRALQADIAAQERLVEKARAQLYAFLENPRVDGSARGRPPEPVEEAAVICAAIESERARGTPARSVRGAVLKRIGSSPAKIEKAPGQLRAHVARTHPHASDAEQRAIEAKLIGAALELLLQYEGAAAQPAVARRSRRNSPANVRYPARSSSA